MKNVLHRTRVVILLYSIGLISIHILKAQSIQPQVVASSGGFYQQGNTVLSWTVGETVTQSCFQTYQTLTQGFQQPYSASLNIKAIIQGYWSGAGTMHPVLALQGEATTGGASDTVVIDLHQASAPYAIVSSAKGILQQDGRVHFSGTAVLGQPYFIAIRHRNALETWSASPVILGENTLYDFTVSAAKAYGSNQVEVAPNVFAFYSGELNGDENIDLVDFTILEADINNFTSGYSASDLNGDGNVDLLDSPLAESNINAFIFSMHP